MGSTEPANYTGSHTTVRKRIVDTEIAMQQSSRIILITAEEMLSLLKIKHIRPREKYGEGEVPHEAKTGGGPTLLTCSFPYVRDWLNNHPFRNSP